MRLNKVIVVFLFILLLSFLYSIIQISNMNNGLIKLKQVITETTNQKDLLKNSLFQSIFFSDFEISDFFYTDNDEKIFLKNIVGDGVLVFRIFENSCSSCVDREFGNISKLEKEGLPILIVASYENRRLLNLYLKEYDIKSKVYNLKSKFCLFQFDKDIDDIYCFLLDSCIDSKYMFFPIQNEQGTSDFYYQFISNVLYDK